MTSIVRIACAALACALLGGCGAAAGPAVASVDLAFPPERHTAAPDAVAPDPFSFPDDSGVDTGPASIDGPRMQCVPYARAHSEVDLHGNASTWWEKANGVFARGSGPVEGSVMVLTGYGRGRGHVAIVRRIVTNREIRIDHANWFNDGAIYVNNPVIDVSDNNDWSQVKVWNIRTGTWGTRAYTVKGFIGPGRDKSNPLVASNTRPDAGDDAIARQIAANTTPARASDAIARQIAAADDSDDLLNDDH